MAPYKQPKSLLGLVRNEIGKLVLSSCLNIDTRLSFQDPAWQVEVDILQELMEQHIPPCEWDHICNVVFKDASKDSVVLKDSRVLFATLVHRNTKELCVKPMCSLTRSCLFYSERKRARNKCTLINPIAKVKERDHREFWIRLVGKLVNVVDLDVKCIDCDDFYAAIGANCHNLESLAHGSCSIKFVSLLKNCTKLRILQCFRGFPIIDSDVFEVQGMEALKTFPGLETLVGCDLLNLLETSAVSRLNVRDVGICLPRDIPTIVQFCPNLTSLHISGYGNTYSTLDVFKTLVASSLRITELGVAAIPLDKHFANFLKAKGNFIKSLSMFSRDETDLDAAIFSIALYCENLTELKVSDRDNKLQKNKLSTKLDSYFKHLKEFTYNGSTSMIPEFCFALSSCSLTALTLTLDSPFDDNDMIALLRSGRLTEIVRLDLTGNLTQTTLHHVYENCPKMKYLRLKFACESGVTFKPIIYRLMQSIRLLEIEARENNLDIVITN